MKNDHKITGTLTAVSFGVDPDDDIQAELDEYVYLTIRCAKEDVGRVGPCEVDVVLRGMDNA